MMMMMTPTVSVLLVLLTLPLAMVSADGPVTDPDLAEVTDLVEDLENERGELSSFPNLMEVATDAIAVIIRKLYQEMGCLWKIATGEIERLDDLIEKYRKLKKEMNGVALSNLERELSSLNVPFVDNLIDTLEDGLLPLDDKIDNATDALNNMLSEGLQTVDDLTEIDLEDYFYLNGNFTELYKTVDDRQCIYGTKLSTIPDSTTVSFLADMSGVPKVAYSIVGFRSHITDLESADRFTFGSVDMMAFNVTISLVTPTGFALTVTEVEDATVHPKDVFVRYMACLGF